VSDWPTAGWVPVDSGTAPWADRPAVSESTALRKAQDVLGLSSISRSGIRASEVVCPLDAARARSRLSWAFVYTLPPLFGCRHLRTIIGSVSAIMDSQQAHRCLMLIKLPGDPSFAGASFPSHPAHVSSSASLSRSTHSLVWISDLISMASTCC
jgi:hypothetical protein